MFILFKVTPDVIPFLTDENLERLGIQTIGEKALLKAKCSGTLESSVNVSSKS